MTRFPCCTTTFPKADNSQPAAASEQPWGAAHGKFKSRSPQWQCLPQTKQVTSSLVHSKKTQNALSYQTYTVKKYEVCGPRDVLEERTPRLTLHHFQCHPLISPDDWEHGRQAVEILPNKYSYICRQLLGTQLKRSHLFSNCTLRLGRDEITNFIIK